MENKAVQRNLHYQTQVVSQLKRGRQAYFTGCIHLGFDQRSFATSISILRDLTADSLIMILNYWEKSQDRATTGPVVFLALIKRLRRRLKTSKFNLEDESLESVYFRVHAFRMSLELRSKRFG